MSVDYCLFVPCSTLVWPYHHVVHVKSTYYTACTLLKLITIKIKILIAILILIAISLKTEQAMQ